MKRKNEILDKYNELYDRYLAEMKEEYLKRDAINCSFNVRVRKNGKKCGYCQHSKIVSKFGKEKVRCEGETLAEKCPGFVGKNTEKSVEEQFGEIIKNPSRCGDKFPKLFILIWALQNGKTRGERLMSLFGHLLDTLGGIFSFRWW